MKLLYLKITAGAVGPYVDLLKENFVRTKRPDTVVDIKDVKQSLQGLSQVAYRSFRFYNDREVFESMLEGYKRGYEAITIGCFYDPCLAVAREAMDIPIVGPAEASMLLASLMGARFGIVTFHPKSEPDIESMIAAYGFEKKALNHRPVRSLGLDIDRQLDGLEHPAPVIEDFKKIALTLIRDGAEVIIPGCLFISPILVKGNLTEIEGVPVLDVISISIKLAEFMNEMTKAGLPIISRRGLYQSPHKNLAEEVRGYFLK